MNLTLRKSKYLDNWYIIERAEHNHTQWLEKDSPNSYSLRNSARFSDADIEGTDAEMLCIADAIENRSEVSFSRCSVKIIDNKAYFDSPRNSTFCGEASLDEADDLAILIRKMLNQFHDQISS